MNQKLSPAQALDEASFGPVQRRVVAFCGLMMLLDGYDIQVIALVVPVLAKSWATPASSFGGILSASVVGIMVGALLFSTLGDRLGRRPVILGSFALVGCSTLLTAGVNSEAGFVACRFLTGLGIGGVLPNAMALVSEYTPARSRAIWISIVGCCVSVGGFIAGLLGAALIVRSGWQSVFVVGGALPLVLLAVAWRYLPESVLFLLGRDAGCSRARALLDAAAPAACGKVSFDTRQRLPSSSLATFGSLWSEGRAIGTVVLWLLFSAGLLMIYLLISWIPALASSSGQRLEVALVATSSFQIGGLIGGLLLGWVLRKRKPVWPLAAAYLIAAAILAGIDLAGISAGLLQVFMVVLGATTFGSQVALNVLAAAHYPTYVRSTGIGWAQGVGRIGAVAGPIAGGYAIAAGWSMADIFVSLACVSAGCAALLVVCRRLPGWGVRHALEITT